LTTHVASGLRPCQKGLFNWFGAFWKIPDLYILQHQSLDAFLYLRFLRVAIIICLVGCGISWPILLPINATGGGGQEQLDILSYANIKRNTNHNRYYAHALVSLVYLSFIMYLIMRECIYFVNLRQSYMLSPPYSEDISSRTVLFCSVPKAYLDEAKLRDVFGQTIKNIWITRNANEVDKLVKECDKVALRLEKAEVKLIKLANNRAVKGGANSNTFPASRESGSVTAQWVPAGKRPTHQKGPLGLFGKKVDTINWCRTELDRLIPAVFEAQLKYRRGDFDQIPGVFIEFLCQANAESAVQTLAHHESLRMTPHYIGIRHNEIVWSSLAVPWWQRVVRTYATYAFIAIMIIFWTIPLAFVGVLSNIDSLASISFLTWINKVPAVILGVITGLLPAILMSILMTLVPVVMRCKSRLLPLRLSGWSADALTAQHARGSPPSHHYLTSNSSPRIPTSPFWSFSCSL